MRNPNRKFSRRSMNQSFEDILNRPGRVLITDTCWLYQGSLDLQGYGRTYIKTERIMIHRAAYKHFKGEIPVGFQIDHLCMVRNCVNPEHLEIVTPKENVHRSNRTAASINSKKTHCVSGHVLDGLNNRGNRFCRVCSGLNNIKWKNKRRNKCL